MTKATRHPAIGLTLWTATIVILLLSTTLQAMPPHRELLSRVAEDPETAPYFLSHLDEIQKRGVGQPYYDATIAAEQRFKSAGQRFTGEYRALVILVEFSDHPAQVSSTYYDSLIFGQNGTTVRDYYDEVSYGKLDIASVDLPSDLGWQTAPQTYSYYVNGENATGAYPQNSQKLVEDLIDQIDAEVDFSQYDNDGDGYVDCLMIVHSGSGAEFSGSNDDIWSHEWAIAPRHRDGVAIATFTMQPEYWSSPGDMTIGVFCHELGHGLGLPDLYDTDYSSNGIGQWGLMSYGSWLGPRNMGGSPAHPMAWCKAQMGFIAPTNVESNLAEQTIVNIEDNAAAYRLWYAGDDSDEYFLVANRQKTGYDSYLPGSGLLIWHIDESRSSNFLEWYPGKNTSTHSLVALEQADGMYDLEKRADAGDRSDPFPGLSGATEFNALSQPNSDSYIDGNSFVAVDEIVESAGVITANLIVGFVSNDNSDEPENLPTSIALAANYPNPFNPTTTIGFSTAESGRAQLDVFNSLGQLISTIYDGPISAGYSEFAWTATDGRGQQLASGVYFYRLSLGDQRVTKKMVLLR
jgi:immune inhibitor A